MNAHERFVKLLQEIKMRELWSNDKSSVKIFGDFSPYPIIVLAAVVTHFGSTEAAFHNIHALRSQNALPRPYASESFPFSMKDVELAIENQRRGERYWVFGTLYPTAYEFVRGYYHLAGDTATFSGGTNVKLYAH